MGSTSRKTTANLLAAMAILSSVACAPTDQQQEGPAALASDTVPGTESVDQAAEPDDEEQRASSPTPSTEWASPSAILAAMGAPVLVTPPSGVEVMSVATSRWRDETRREVLEVAITVTSNLAPADLACQLVEQPVVAAPPSDNPNYYRSCDDVAAGGEQFEDGITVFNGAPDVPLPTYDSFYDWNALRTTVAGSVAASDGPSTAVVVLQARRQAQDAGDGLPHTDIATPLHTVAQLVPAMSATGSTITWYPENPNTVEARASLTGLPERAEDTVGWMRSVAISGTFRDEGETASATLGGEPPVEMTWRAGGYLNSGSLRFAYDLGADGLPLPTPAIAISPVWTELVSWGDRWPYDADGVEDDGWWQSDFDDSSWVAGNAPFGRDEPATTAFPTPEPGMTGWFRRSFNVENVAAIDRLDVEALIDDGAVVYLNGAELYRWNMPEGPLDAGTLAVERISGDDEEVIRRAIELPTELLVEGTNVIAVAVHQAAPDSSDVRFDLRLAAAQRIY
jgi:hypothetical protein